METQTTPQDMMHGSVFVLLQQFVESTEGVEAWSSLLKKVGIDHPPYQKKEMYPTDELFALMGQISEDRSISPYELMEQYGEFLVPDLLDMYRKYINPQWRTYEMLLNTEEAMHGAVRREDHRTTPPRLLVTKQDSSRMVIEYYSDRRLSGVAVGIIRGIARHYGEENKVAVTRLSKPESEMVQILVDFKE